jgi:hypothetical protein
MPLKPVLFVLFVALSATACDRKDSRFDYSSPTGPSGTTFTQLSVSPTNAVHQTGVKQCFTATGGDGRYRWVLDNGTGPLEAGNEDRACYIASFPIRYTMTVHSGNQSVTARGEVIR